MGASATVPVAEQAASSGDCSTVNLEVCNPSQDGTSFMPHQPAAAMQSPAQHAQQAVTSLVSRQPAVQDQAAASRAGRHLRKRKQPPSEEGQQRAAGSTSMAANAARGKTLGVNKEQAGLVPVSLHCKGHQQGSDLSGGQPEAPTNRRRVKGKGSKFDAFVGRTIDVPAPVFGVDIPDLYYRGTVLKKDNSHPGSMVVRFTEDGSRYWFPLAEIQRFLTDMQNKGRDAGSDTIGQGSHAFAAQVLAGSLVAKRKASGLTSSSATTGSHGIEVSSGIRQDTYRCPALSRFSAAAFAGKKDEGTSSLQALAAAADSGDV